MSDDISMKSLKGSIKENTTKAFEAGCDLVLHCNFENVSSIVHTFEIGLKEFHSLHDWSSIVAK